MGDLRAPWPYMGGKSSIAGELCEQYNGAPKRWFRFSVDIPIVEDIHPSLTADLLSAIAVGVDEEIELSHRGEPDAKQYTLGLTGLWVQGVERAC